MTWQIGFADFEAEQTHFWGIFRWEILKDKTELRHNAGPAVHHQLRRWTVVETELAPRLSFTGRFLKLHIQLAQRWFSVGPTLRRRANIRSTLGERGIGLAVGENSRDVRMTTRPQWVVDHAGLTCRWTECNLWLFVIRWRWWAVRDRRVSSFIQYYTTDARADLLRTGNDCCS